VDIWDPCPCRMHPDHTQRYGTSAPCFTLLLTVAAILTPFVICTVHALVLFESLRVGRCEAALDYNKLSNRFHRLSACIAWGLTNTMLAPAIFTRATGTRAGSSSMSFIWPGFLLALTGTSFSTIAFVTAKGVTFSEIPFIIVSTCWTFFLAQTCCAFVTIKG
jgi:hypothetical protein